VTAALPAALGPTPAGLPPDWPHRARSHRLEAGGLRWHVQWLAAPVRPLSVVLMLHGTGASSHSLAELAGLLSQQHTVIVPDLPGHAYTSRADSALSLPGMALAVGALLRALEVQPDWIVGHSAGAAIAARLCLDGHASPRTLVSLNGAWFPPRGVGNWWYAPAARLLARNTLVPHLFAWQASRPATLDRLIASTGSRLGTAAVARYGQLVADPAHVGGVLAMMAQWDLQPLLQDLPRLRPHVALVVGERDSTVPPEQAQAVRQRLPQSSLHRLPGLGHLAHEEAPQTVAGLLTQLRPWVPGDPAATPD
jgi:magnesium chelatase accessory protein